MKYKLLEIPWMSNCGGKDATRIVQVHLDEGWEPLGPPVIKHITIFQALTKEAK